MTELRKDLPEIPERLKRRPVDHRGYPVPWFVTEKDDKGNWEFRVVAPWRAVEAIRHNLCFLCGERLGSYKAFVVGPMCVVNRISAEAPIHKECAEFSVIACPFMLRPQAQRREAGLDERVKDGQTTPGVMLPRNPGVSVIYITKKMTIRRTRTPNGGIGHLFHMGNPTEVMWYKEGRLATRDEVEASIYSGMIILEEMAEEEGNFAKINLRKAYASALQTIPPVEEGLNASN